MVIYIDLFFLENFIINYLVLVTTSKIIQTNIKKQTKKLFVSATIGSGYSVVNVLLSGKISNLKIIISLIMIYLAFEPKKIKTFLNYLILFYLISFTFGGAILAFICMIKNKREPLNEEDFILRDSSQIIFIAVLVAIFIIKKSFTLGKKRINNENIICKIIIYVNNKCLKVNALIDSGNLLQDPMTNKPIIVIEVEKIKKIINEIEMKKIIGLLNNKNNINELNNEYKERIRMIPFKSIGQEKGFMIGIKSDRLKILIEEGEINKENVVLALYNNKLTKDDKYNALIGLNIL